MHICLFFCFSGKAQGVEHQEPTHWHGTGCGAPDGTTCRLPLTLDTYLTCHAVMYIQSLRTYRVCTLLLTTASAYVVQPIKGREEVGSV